MPSIKNRTPRFVGRPPRRAALRIAIIYALIGGCWILVSDLISEKLTATGTFDRYHIQTIKGLVFILVTAAMVYVLIRRTVTAFRATDAARHESENRLKLLIERARDYAIFTLDNAGNVTSWNRGAQQITDWTESEIIGQPLNVFYIADDVANELPAKELARARTEGYAEVEALRARQDGTQFWANFHITALKGDHEETSGFLVVLRDVTERRRAQDALRQVNRTLATVIENSPLAIVTLDLFGQVVSWNAAAERLFGWKESEVLGKSLPAVPRDRKELFEENNRKLLRGERLEGMEVPGLRANGTQVDVAVWGAPLIDFRGTIVGNVRLYADISERKRWENDLKEFNEMLERRVAERTAMLEEANEELQAFSFTVSHDLRLPLRSLQAIAKDLLTSQSERLNEAGNTDALRIVGAAARMERQIEDLLEYSRISRSELRLEPVSLVLIVHELIGRLERDPAYAEAQFVVQEPLGWVKAHALTLQYVILNLLVNAVTHVGPNVRPSIHISTHESGDTLRLYIEDNSTNQAPGDMEQLREPLQPGARATEARLGLSLVRRGIERMGGTVGVEPSPSNGTRFWIQLPRGD
jgi:PAS domain S-box-containing protein